MVHIKKLDVFGFKSFGSKNITLNFQKGLIAVTGPNGSGKSNILDAILFALGENSPKALRVDKFQSLFHDNSVNSNSHKVVKVSLTFDNEDRGIPIDTNHVTITREMTGINTGESQYYLNNKKVSRNNILELLEIVVASPNKLNIVQQGMITRISELNSDERRRIIEDIIGLSYFDEKKNQAYKQLDESDRRLEIALAKMDEVRNRINELEEERNYQHRYIQIESEINRLKAVKLFGNIYKTSQKITNLVNEKNKVEEEIKKVSGELNNITLQIEKKEKEKQQFFIQSNSANKDRIENEKSLSSVVYQYERNKAIIKEAEHNINQLYQKEKTNDSELNTYNYRSKELARQLEKTEEEIGTEEEIKVELVRQLELIDEEIKEKNNINSNELNRKQFLQNRINKLTNIKNNTWINNVRTEEQIKSHSEKIKVNDLTIHNILLKNHKNKEKKHELNIKLNDIDKEIKEGRKQEQVFNQQFLKMDKEIGTSKNVLENAEKIIIKYEEKIKLAKNSLTEDYAIATLLKDFKSLDVIGYVFNLLTWNKKYQKAVIASGNEWMKAVVVKDIKSMIMLAEFSKNKKISFLKIIPQELLRGKRIEKIPEDPSILGVLSDFVSSKINYLPEFLFGTTILTSSPLAAYVLSNRGYKAVSTSGEIFYPNLSLMQFDYGSKIIDMTKDILLSDSVENLKENINRLREISDIRAVELNSLYRERDTISKNIEKKIAERFETEKNINDLENLVTIDHQNLERLFITNKDYNQNLERLFLKHQHHNTRLKTITGTINRLENELTETEKRIETYEIKKIHDEKNILSHNLNKINSKLNQLKLNQSISINNLDNINTIYQKIIKEKEQIEIEKMEKKRMLDRENAVSKDIEEKLRRLREKENEIIQSTSSIYIKLQEFEDNIKGLTDHEKKLTRHLNQLEREIGFIRKDVTDLENQMINQTNELTKTGYKNLEESFEVDDLYLELKKEFENIKEKVNFRADETYLEIIDGYRGLSDKKNHLEEERNSIVNFIEEISKEKANVFNEAFNKVDVDIRKTFSEITGGKAWLELEDKENIFSGGILLMVQFPNKPARESTSLSGGEKTMAAIVFLLALQSLKPSPFYLMDEVDAHLDAQNTDRLSKILLLRSINSQIIMVTLKDSTVAKSDLIFGVYPKEGISQVVKYNHPSKVKLEIR